MQPPPKPSAPYEPLYEAFFGLREQPFALTTDPKFLLMTGTHTRAYEQLLAGLKRREGLMILTGDTGMGKTTLCRGVIEALGPNTFSALILNPYMSDAEVVRVILRDFGLVTRDEIRHGAFGRADMPQLLDTLERFLRSLVPLNAYAVVVIDEAQSLPARVLDQIRQLLAFEQDGQRLLQIILAGQPGLLTTLGSEAMRAVDQRISRRATLGAMSPPEVDTYIKHRLSVAGGKDTVTFTTESVTAIAELTGRVPRRINLLCDRALEEARAAGTNVIVFGTVHRAVRSLDDAKMKEGLEALPQSKDEDPIDATESGNSPVEWLRDHWTKLLLGAAVAVVIGYFGWCGRGVSASTPPLPASPPVARVPDPRPMPTDDDVRYVMHEMAKK